MRTVYRYWISIVAAAVLVQIAFAGYGAFYAAHKIDDETTIDEDIFMDGFGLHTGFGYLVVLMGLLALVFALLARPGRRTVWMTAGLFGLLVLQVLLAWFGFEVPAIGAFHPLNALLIAALAGTLASQEWRMSRAAATPRAEPTPPPA